MYPPRLLPRPLPPCSYFRKVNQNTFIPVPLLFGTAEYLAQNGETLLLRLLSGPQFCGPEFGVSLYYSLYRRHIVETSVEISRKFRDMSMIPL